ncbi:MAG TPA: DUF456 domain-containing protein [Bacteroidales bacterium]|nr:DUF456 domain-containing protein [Bacteroidales bacterium]
MDTFLIILGLIFTLTGLLGCLLPAIPGPPLSFIALLLVHLTKEADLSNSLLLAMAVLTIVVMVLDYIIPLWGTKKFGGTKFGTWGATIGLIIGFFLGPLGIIIGPFAGAVLGEMVNGSSRSRSLRAGIGSFLGFLMGIGLKLVVSGIMTFYYFKYSLPVIKNLISTL